MSRLIQKIFKKNKKEYKNKKIIDSVDTASIKQEGCVNSTIIINNYHASTLKDSKKYKK